MAKSGDPGINTTDSKGGLHFDGEPCRWEDKR